MPQKITYGTIPNRPLSPAVRAGDFVYVSGQVPTDASGAIVSGGIEAQVRQVFENIRAALALAGGSLDQIVKTTCVLQDARDFEAFNRAYSAFFPKEPPARTTIEARLMIDIRVEIDAVAYVPQG
jgi:2-iminobutanoate/2-iminopropanoate deaminase